MDPIDPKPGTQAENPLPIWLAGVPTFYSPHPALPPWEQIRPAVELLAASAVEAAGQAASAGAMLALGSGLGSLPAALRSLFPGRRLVIYDTDSLAVVAARRCLGAQSEAGLLLSEDVLNDDVLNEDVDLPGWLAGSAAAAWMLLPKGRQQARRWLLQARQALRPGGRLYLAGANHQGIQPAIKDASELFQASVLLGYRQGHRLARLAGPLPAADLPEWSRQPGLQPGSWLEFSAELNGRRFQLASLPGVFAYDHIDEATRLLLESIQASPSERLLDLGCGLGVLGLALAASAAWVDLVDSDLTAVSCARRNLAYHHIANAAVFSGDGALPVIGQRYHLVVSNPPFHAGRVVQVDTALRFVEQAWEVLLPGGRLALVANRFLPYEKAIQRRFNNVARLAGNNRFQVYHAVKSP